MKTILLRLMSSDLIRISTPEGPVTLNKKLITAIEPLDEGTKIQVETFDSATKSFITSESYDSVVMLYFLL